MMTFSAACESFAANEDETTGRKSIEVDVLAVIGRCAVERRRLLAGANPARQLSLQPVAIGAGDGGNDMA